MPDKEMGTSKDYQIRSQVPEVRIEIADGERLQVEFRIDDLVRKLIPGGLVASSCDGCHGCSGCSM